VIAEHLRNQNHYSTIQAQELMQWRALQFLATRNDLEAINKIRMMAGLSSNSSSNMITPNNDCMRRTSTSSMEGMIIGNSNPIDITSHNLSSDIDEIVIYEDDFN
jgi:hypothetical protein